MEGVLLTLVFLSTLRILIHYRWALGHCSLLSVLGDILHLVASEGQVVEFTIAALGIVSSGLANSLEAQLLYRFSSLFFSC